MTKFYKFECGRCTTVFVADTTRHRMDCCPNCGNNGPSVDLEEHYCRHILDEAGNQCKMIEQFTAPRFEDPEDYHSALLGWLNDSDEEYELSKESEILLVKRIKKEE